MNNIRCHPLPWTSQRNLVYLINEFYLADKRLLFFVISFALAFISCRYIGISWLFIICYTSFPPHHTFKRFYISSPVNEEITEYISSAGNIWYVHFNISESFIAYFTSFAYCRLLSTHALTCPREVYFWFSRRCLTNIFPKICLPIYYREKKKKKGYYLYMLFFSCWIGNSSNYSSELYLCRHNIYQCNVLVVIFEKNISQDFSLV